MLAGSSKANDPRVQSGAALSPGSHMVPLPSIVLVTQMNAVAMWEEGGEELQGVSWKLTDTGRDRITVRITKA